MEMGKKFNEEIENKAIEYSEPIFTGLEILHILHDETLVKKNSIYNKNSFYPSGRKELKSRKYSIIDSLKFQLFFELDKYEISKTNAMKVLSYFNDYRPRAEKAKGIEYLLLGCFYGQSISINPKDKFIFAIDSEFKVLQIFKDSIGTWFFARAQSEPYILIPFYLHCQITHSYDYNYK